jgi:hypothetical protein
MEPVLGLICHSYDGRAGAGLAFLTRSPGHCGILDGAITAQSKELPEDDITR